jgi:farnesyl-diphosphate farnesyltransferase
MSFDSGEMHNLLKGVSRSFYLTLRVLPQSINMPLSVAYLLARATDTIADTGLIDIERRREALLHFREVILRTCDDQSCNFLAFGDLAQANSGTPAERELLANTGDVLDALSSLPAPDRVLIQAVMNAIIHGQELDLIRFGSASSTQIISLNSDAELDEYTYSVAGCVGAFWTKVCRAHLISKADLNDEAFVSNGIRYGKGLQLVNILRDLPKDLRQGRCYIPTNRLSEIGLSPQDLLDTAAMDRFRPLYDMYLQLAEEHLSAGWQYVRMLPFTQLRVRLACSWPILIAIKTLSLLKTENVLDDRRRVKISRAEIHGLIIKSVLTYPIPSIWIRRYDSERIF